MTNKANGTKGARPSTTKAVLNLMVLLAAFFCGVAWSNSYFHFELDPSYLSSLEGLKADFGGAVSSGSSSKKNLVVEDLQDRVRYLETKLNAYLAFASDPFLATRTPAKCEKPVGIKKIACQENKECTLDDQRICLDNFPAAAAVANGISLAKAGEGDNKSTTDKKNCVVYDFGIRTAPEYGLAFAKAPFNCQVVGFDPSPISEKWWREKKDEILATHPGYIFKPVGSGGHDGILELREYDWGQVSIIEFPTLVVNPTRCNQNDQCNYTRYNQQGKFKVPVRTLSTLMKELGHNRIDLLKLDVEGSEYLFLEKMIDDLSCRLVDQLTMEWHHYNYDTRYGISSNPQRNILVALLNDRCGLEQFEQMGGWPSNIKQYTEMGMTLYYTLTSFKRTRWDF
jgi:FkbM family methyltransferase